MKTILLSSCITLLCASYIISQPFITTYKIVRAVDTIDTKALSMHINYNKLTASLSQQMHQQILAYSNYDNNNMLDKIASKALQAGISTSLNYVITEDNIGLLLKSGFITTDHRDGNEYSYKYIDINTFKMSLRQDESEVTFYLKRHGFNDWKITNIENPNFMLEDLLN